MSGHGGTRDLRARAVADDSTQRALSLTEIERLLVHLLHVGLGEPDEPRLREEEAYLAAAVTRATCSKASLQSLQDTIGELKCLSLEHFSILRNRKGFPCAANRDSSWRLVMEASPHGQTALA